MGEYVAWQGSWGAWELGSSWLLILRWCVPIVMAWLFPLLNVGLLLVMLRACSHLWRH